jgi:hypothetical protein
MATNVATPIYEPGQRVSGRPAADVFGKRFVKLSASKDPASRGLDDRAFGGNIKIVLAGAGDIPIGVTEYDCAADGKQSSIVTVFTDGYVVPVTAGAALVYGDWVAAGANGMAVKAADRASSCGRCWQDTAIGEDAIVKLSL